jgi:quercetin dioxygenase-like cupin family protein
MMLHPSYLETDSPLDTAPADLRRLLSIAHDLSRWAAKWPGMSAPAERCWQTIARNDELEAMVIAWPVGGSIELHDHGPSSGAVVVVAGQLTESFLVPGAGTLATRTVVEDDGIVFGRGHVHDVSNAGPRPAISVHVYSPALTSMRFFDLVEGTLVEMRAESYALGDAQP